MLKAKKFTLELEANPISTIISGLLLRFPKWHANNQNSTNSLCLSSGESPADQCPQGSVQRAVRKPEGQRSGWKQVLLCYQCLKLPSSLTQTAVTDIDPLLCMALTLQNLSETRRFFIYIIPELYRPRPCGNRSKLFSRALLTELIVTQLRQSHKWRWHVMDAEN